MRDEEKLPPFDGERNEGIFIDDSIIVASPVTSDRLEERSEEGMGR